MNRPAVGARRRFARPASIERRGGLGKVHQLFGADLPGVLASLNEALAA
jgi:hypothetical protein